MAAKAKAKGKKRTAPEATFPPEPVDPAIDEAILVDPEGHEPYERCEAFLRERGDPRADLIAEHLRGGDRDVLAAHSRRFLGPHLVPKRPPGAWPHRAPMDWHAGFLRFVSLVVDTPERAAHTADFLALRSCRFLRELEVQVVKGVVDFSKAPSLPLLRKLGVTGGDTDVGGAELRPETVESIGRAGYDRLEDLFVSFGDSEDERCVTAFEPIFEGGCPALRHLHVFMRSRTVAATFVRRLAGSAALERLETLALIRVGAVEVIVGRAEAFAHLEKFLIDADDDDRFRLTRALPGVGGIADGLPQHITREASGAPPAKSAVTHAVPLAACAACASFDVVPIQYEQEEVHPMANNDLASTSWTVHCRACNKLTTWSGRY